MYVIQEYGIIRLRIKTIFSFVNFATHTVWVGSELPGIEICGIIFGRPLPGCESSKIYKNFLFTWQRKTKSNLSGIRISKNICTEDLCG